MTEENNKHPKQNQEKTQEVKSNQNHENEQEENGFEIAKNSLRRKQKERKLRKQRKKLNQFKNVARFFLFWGVVFLIYKFIGLPGWYLRGDIFKISDTNVVNIMNNNIISEDMIFENLADVQIPQLPIFMMGVNEIKHEIYKNPIVKRVYVRRYAFPARMDIIIKERVPIVLLKTNLKSNPVAFYTSDNILIKDKKYMSYPFSKSLKTILVKSPFSSKSWTKKKFTYIEKIINAVEQNSGEPVQYIDMRKPNDVYIKIPTASIRLGSLDSTIFERIQRIYTILPKINDLKGKVKYIDLSWDKVNYIKLK